MLEDFNITKSLRIIVSFNNIFLILFYPIKFFLNLLIATSTFKDLSKILNFWSAVINLNKSEIKIPNKHD